MVARLIVKLAILTQSAEARVPRDVRVSAEEAKDKLDDWKFLPEDKRSFVQFEPAHVYEKAAWAPRNWAEGARVAPAAWA